MGKWPAENGSYRRPGKIPITAKPAASLTTTVMRPLTASAFAPRMIARQYLTQKLGEWVGTRQEYRLPSSDHNSVQSN
jgi:hypothetical protein